MAPCLLSTIHLQASPYEQYEGQVQLQLTCWISCRSFLSALLAMGLGATTWPSSVDAPATAAVVASCPTYSSNLKGYSTRSVRDAAAVTSSCEQACPVDHLAGCKAQWYVSPQEQDRPSYRWHVAACSCFCRPRKAILPWHTCVVQLHGWQTRATSVALTACPCPASGPAL